ncbi:MAG TPA: hypothetical protein VHH73_13805 [Verrucomicrobiae bacterium]|nr:hypothetical protein [Verrucomicrobiae bacterium]
MKRIIDTSQILGTVELPDGLREICATAVASYDEASRHLVTRLDSFLRATGSRVEERHVSAPWLPPAETLTETAEPEEAPDLAREIFHRWVAKVRQSAPSIHSATL